MHKLRSIQVLRGIAAAAVVVHHAYRHVDPNGIARVGAAGVDLFFVISGFIMATIGPGRRPGDFIFDRVWRIFPMWLIAVSPWLLIGHHDLPTVLTSLTLWPIWNGTFHTPALLLGWTLCFEMLFYCAFALALASKPVVPLVAFAFCILLAPKTDLFSYVGSPMIIEFLAGVCIAQLPRIRYPGILMIVGAALFCFAPMDAYTWIFGWHGFDRLLGWGIPSVMIVYGAISMDQYFKRPAFNFAVLLGDASFSIYLFHEFIVLGLMPWPAEVAAAIGLGVAAYWVIERRLIVLKPKFRRPLVQAPS